MRILVVVHGYPPHQTNGAELHAHRKCRWWKAHGHTVRVVSADPVANPDPAAREFLQSRQELDGIDVVRLTFPAPNHASPFSETYCHPLLESVLDHEIRDFQPDLVYQVSGYIFGMLPPRLARRHNIPAVLFATDYWHVCPRITLLRPNGTCCPGPTRPSQCAACRVSDRSFVRRFGPHATAMAWTFTQSLGHALWSVHLCDPTRVNEIVRRRSDIQQNLPSYSLVVANSRFLENQLLRVGIPNDRLLVVRQGINVDEFNGVEFHQVRRDPGIRLLYLGQISRHKGVDLLVDAVEDLAGAGLAVQLAIHGNVTDGDPRIQRLFDDPTLRATAIGPRLTRDQLVRELANHDVIVVPSRWYDNSPNVILEAFAAGKPVITANHGGMAEMVRDGVDGLLFRPGDQASLRETLRRLCTEPDLLPRLRMGITKPYGVDEEMRVEHEAIQRLFEAAIEA